MPTFTDTTEQEEYYRQRAIAAGHEDMRTNPHFRLLCDLLPSNVPMKAGKVRITVGIGGCPPTKEGQHVQDTTRDATSR